MSGSIPDITPPSVDVGSLTEEKKQFGDLDEFERVDIKLRSMAGFVALAFVITFWLAAICLVIAMGFHFSNVQIPSDNRWTAAVALTVALFTAPTVIILSVLSSTRKRRSESNDSSEEAILPFARIGELFVKPDK